MTRKSIRVMTVAAALSCSLAAVAYAQNFVFRTEVTGSTGDPGIILTLVSGSGLQMQLDAAGAEPGLPVSGETRTLTYRNEVSREIEITNVSVSPSQANFVILTDGCTGTLAVGGQCSIQLQFQAVDDGSYSGMLNLEAS